MNVFSVFSIKQLFLFLLFFSTPYFSFANKLPEHQKHWIPLLRFSNPYESCSGSQISTLRSVQNRIASRLSELKKNLGMDHMSYVKEHYLIPKNISESADKNQRYKQYLIRLQHTFAMMSDALSDQIHFHCKDSEQEKRCKNEEVSAYVLTYFGKTVPKIHLCSSLFKKNNSEMEETIFHELSHLAANTEDLIDWRSDIRQAPNDAFYIEKFMHKAVDSSSLQDIWHMNWIYKKY